MDQCLKFKLNPSPALSFNLKIFQRFFRQRIHTLERLAYYLQRAISYQVDSINGKIQPEIEVFIRSKKVFGVRLADRVQSSD